MQLSWQRIIRTAAAALCALAAFGAQAQKIYNPLPNPFPKFVLPAPDDFVEITAGSNHTCARKHNGNVYCWGLNSLGEAGVQKNRTCGGNACVDRPSLVLTGARQVDAGTQHTCALTTGGATFCWGSSHYGQLGAGVYGDTTATGPLQVQGPAFTAISAGGYSGCGINASGVFCWGIMGGSPQPAQIATYGGYTGVQVGYQHACLNVNMGSWSELDCWGYNRWGQVGIDPAFGLNVIPAPRTTFGTDVGAASVQNDVTCVNQRSGTVQCVGANYHGQLGGGSADWAQHFMPVTVGGGMKLRGVSVGENHACALDPAGAAWCWGRGNYGQAGVDSYNSPTLTFPTPVQVPGGNTFRAIAAGGLHTCAIGTNNKLYCWGSNYLGQLGTQYPGGWVWIPVQTLDPV